MKSPAARAQAGFTLLEVLITIVIVAVGLLGTAALQAYAIKVSQGGQFRTQAVLLATDLLERLEANNAAAATGSYVADLPRTTAASDCSAASCTASEMAAYDLSRFQERMQAALPDSSASITRDGAGPWVYQIKITWKERSFKQKSTTSSTGNTETFSYTVQRRVNDPASVS
jgi:type IV pilus assembly protein PilV